MQKYDGNNKYDVFSSKKMKGIKIAIVILVLDIVAIYIYVRFIKH